MPFFAEYATQQKSNETTSMCLPNKLADINLISDPGGSSTSPQIQKLCRKNSITTTTVPYSRRTQCSLHKPPGGGEEMSMKWRHVHLQKWFASSMPGVQSIPQERALWPKVIPILPKESPKPRLMAMSLRAKSLSRLPPIPPRNISGEKTRVCRFLKSRS